MIPKLDLLLRTLPYLKLYVVKCQMCGRNLYICFTITGPVILPDDSQPSNLADDKTSSLPDRVVRRQAPDQSPPIPEQIHIAYGDMPSEMVIVWSSPSPGSSEVLYGMAPNNFSLKALGDSQELLDWEGTFEGVKFIHRVKLEVTGALGSCGHVT